MECLRNFSLIHHHYLELKVVMLERGMQSTEREYRDYLYETTIMPAWETNRSKHYLYLGPRDLSVCDFKNIITGCSAEGRHCNSCLLNELLLKKNHPVPRLAEI